MKKKSSKIQRKKLFKINCYKKYDKKKSQQNLTAEKPKKSSEISKI